MNILAVSINHHTASVELREALHLSEDEIRKLIQHRKGRIIFGGTNNINM